MKKDSLIGFLIFAALLALVIYVAGSNNRGGPDKDNVEPPSVGMSAKISQGGEGYACFASVEHLHAFIDALSKNDETGAHDEMLYAFDLHRGEKVTVVERQGLLGTELRLRVLEGEGKGQACWVEGDRKDLFAAQ